MHKIVLTVIIGIIFFSVTVYSQSSDASETKFSRLEKVIRQDGWEIPNVNSGIQTNKEISESGGIIVRRYSFSKSKLVHKIDYYFLNEKDKSLKTFTKECWLRDGASYSINGKIYAYNFTCVPVLNGKAVNEKGEVIGRTQQFAGATLGFSYFDEDGDGKFETKYLTTEMPNIVPDLVKQQ